MDGFILAGNEIVMIYKDKRMTMFSADYGKLPFQLFSLAADL